MNDSSSPAMYRPIKVLLVIFIMSFLNNPTLCDSMGQAPAVNTNPNVVQSSAGEQAISLENKIIDSISVMGNIYITKGKIIAAARSRAGQTFTTPQAQEDCKRIANLLGVEFVYYSVEPVGDKVKLTFVIKEKIVIRTLTFTGDKKTKECKLAEKAGFQRGDYLDKLTAADGAEKLTDHYKSTGFPFVKVTYDDSQ
jgi:outer membrane protein assembly factor BamA